MKYSARRAEMDKRKKQQANARAQFRRKLRIAGLASDIIDTEMVLFNQRLVLQS